METKRQIIYFKNYYKDFFNVQTEKVKDKIDYVLFSCICCRWNTEKVL
jgi:hypothetical protein